MTTTKRALDLTAPTKKTTSKNDHNHQLGHLIDGEGGRDAIHIAIMPATAGERLAPGQHVGIKDGHAVLYGVDRVGIVDPFLTKNLERGDRFYICLYPNTITSLRHVWTHDLIDAEVPAPAVNAKAAAEVWMMNLANELEISYDKLMKVLDGSAKFGDYHVLHFDTPDIVWKERETMWAHFETLTGQKVSDDARKSSPFSCSC